MPPRDLFRYLLYRRVEGGFQAAGFRNIPAHECREVRRRAGLGFLSPRDGFFRSLDSLPGRKYPPPGKLTQDFIPFTFRVFRVPDWVVSRGRARERREQCYLARRERTRAFPEVKIRRCAHTFYIAAVRSEVQIDFEELVVIEYALQLKGAERLFRFGKNSPRLWVGHAGNLHRYRRSARDDPPLFYIGVKSPHKGKRIHTRMTVEPPVFRGNHGFGEPRGNVRELYREAPALVLRQKEPERPAVLVRDDRSRFSS